MPIEKTLRIFISSPGDVVEERDRAKSVVEELRRRYIGRLDLHAVLWEELALTAEMSFQQGIDLVLSERGVDIAVFILWSRLGSPLGACVRKPDGAEYRSGTEREWDLMWRAREQSGEKRPRIIVYARCDEPSFDERLRGLPTEDKDRLLQQKKLVEQFIAEEFRDGATGHNVRAYHSFDRPTTFAQRLRVHLQDLLDPLAGGELVTPFWDIEKHGPPFLGLDAFQFEHSSVFFGREDEIVAIRHLLREQARRGCAFVLIAGASGSGKSSLARAGVLPAVATYEIDEDVAGWRIAVFTPAEGGGDLLFTLARALTAASALPALLGDPGAVAHLAGDLSRDPEMVCRRVIRPMLASDGQRNRLLVLVDQFEEIFADQRFTAEARNSFTRALEALARSGWIWVLATVRSDFYAQCQGLDALVQMKEGGGQFDLVPPGADALDRLIRQPATLAGLCFEKRGATSLADVILRDATAHRELLPLLEYLLHRLCAERSNGVLTFNSYETLGGVEGALARRADAVLAEIHPSEATLDALLAALVTLSGDEQESFVRRRVPRSELERNEESRVLVTTLIGERLLTSSAQAGSPAIVTIAHEALFRVWSQAVSWLGRNREFLRLRANVMQSSARWESAARDDSLLLPSGLPIEEAGRLLTIEAGRLEAPVRKYVNASIAYRNAQDARSRRRSRIVLGLLSILTLFAIIAAILAVRGYQESSLNLTRANREKERAQENEGVARVAQQRAETGEARAREAAAKEENQRRQSERLVSLLIIAEDEVVGSLQQAGSTDLARYFAQQLSGYRKAYGIPENGELKPEVSLTAHLTRAERLFAEGQLAGTLIVATAVRKATESRLKSNDAQVEIRLMSARANMAIGQVLIDQSFFNEAIKAQQSALKVLAPLPKSALESDDGYLLSVDAITRIGDSYHLSDHFVEAFRFYSDALTEVQRIADTHASTDHLLLRLSEAHGHVADVEYQAFATQTHVTEAIGHYEQATKLAETVFEKNPTNRDALELTGRMYQAKGRLLSRGNPSEGISAMRRGAELREALVQMDPSSASAHRELASVHWKLAEALLRSVPPDRRAAIISVRRGIETLDESEKAHLLVPYDLSLRDYLRQWLREL
jgi:tetratricopeptide (TPR) repeat protein